MRVRVNIYLAALVLALVVVPSARFVCAQSVSKWKYVPQALKTPKIPAVINPQLPLSVQRNLAAQLARPSVTQHTIPEKPLPQFFNFLNWTKKLPQTQRTIPTEDTRWAIVQLRRAVFQYSSLSATEQQKLQHTVQILDEIYPSLQYIPNKYSKRLIYRGTEGKENLPQLAGFHIRLKEHSMPLPFPKREIKKHLDVSSLYLAFSIKVPDQLAGFTFKPSHTIQTAKMEFKEVLTALVPPGYTVRMGPKELGIKADNLDHFRTGYLHMHLEKVNAFSDALPVDISIRLWISAKPYAAEVDPITRKIIVSFDDKKIAQNYLFLFEDYLDQKALQALSQILYATPTSPTEN